MPSVLNHFLLSLFLMKYPLNIRIAGYHDWFSRLGAARRGPDTDRPGSDLRSSRHMAARTLNKRETRKYITGHDTMCARADAKTPSRAPAPSIAVQLLVYDTIYNKIEKVINKV